MLVMVSEIFWFINYQWQPWPLYGNHGEIYIDCSSLWLKTYRLLVLLKWTVTLDTWGHGVIYIYSLFCKILTFGLQVHPKLKENCKCQTCISDQNIDRNIKGYERFINVNYNVCYHFYVLIKYVTWSIHKSTLVTNLQHSLGGSLPNSQTVVLNYYYWWLTESSSSINYCRILCMENSRNGIVLSKHLTIDNGIFCRHKHKIYRVYVAYHTWYWNNV